MKKWETKFYILRRDESLSQQVMLECFAQKTTVNNSVVGKYINVSKNVHTLEIIDCDFVQKLKTSNMIPQNLNITKSTKSDKAYSFIMRVKEQNVVFSALNERSFIQWIRALNVAISYLNPYQITDIFSDTAREELTMKDGLDSICSILIEKYIDSARFQRIGKEQFRHVVAGCIKPSEQPLVDRILWQLRQMVSPVNMGWNGVAAAVEQEIDLNLAKCIQSTAHALPCLNYESGRHLVSLLQTKTIRTLSDTERIYIEALLSRYPHGTAKMMEIPLTVHRHRGHLEKDTWGEYVDKYHPQNLLDKNETQTYYQSDWNKPAVGDWITFKFEIQSSSIVTPKAIVIRNSNWGDGLKSISLSLSVDGEEFEDFAVIQEIRNDTSNTQHFILDEVMLSQQKMWMNYYKFLKLVVLSNCGLKYNKFHSFSVLCRIPFKFPGSLSLPSTS